eukprot:TRINITY_DN717_c5_g1_i1.p1 TRINITY_DN717_c5_g1~~TRINITY_DN717_c5_g1_i1.p1  ORF type:complete len:358 (+),score=97.10 TRINITY_DN717_c5_g1_i1:150-1076(+)
MQAALLFIVAGALIKAMQFGGPTSPVSEGLVFAVAAVCAVQRLMDAGGGGGSSALERSGAVVVEHAAAPKGTLNLDGGAVTDSFEGCRTLPPTTRCPKYTSSVREQPLSGRTPPAQQVFQRSGAAPRAAAQESDPTFKGRQLGRDFDGCKWSDSFEGTVVAMPSTMCPTYASSLPRLPSASQQQHQMTRQVSNTSSSSPRRRVAGSTQGPDTLTGAVVQPPSARCPTYAPAPAAPAAAAAAAAAPAGGLRVGCAVVASDAGLAQPHVRMLLPAGEAGEVVGFNRYGDPQVKTKAGRVVALLPSNVRAA